jgi:hypothetical protein
LGEPYDDWSEEASLGRLGEPVHAWSRGRDGWPGRPPSGGEGALEDDWARALFDDGAGGPGGSSGLTATIQRIPSVVTLSKKLNFNLSPSLFIQRLQHVSYLAYYVCLLTSKINKIYLIFLCFQTEIYTYSKILKFLAFDGNPIRSNIIIHFHQSGALSNYSNQSERRKKLVYFNWHGQ